MAGETVLVQKIERSMVVARATDHARWTIGLAASPDSRAEVLDFPGFFRHWPIESEEQGREIVEHLVTKGMKRDSGHGSATPTCVYIF